MSLLISPPVPGSVEKSGEGVSVGTRSPALLRSLGFGVVNAKARAAQNSLSPE